MAGDEGSIKGEPVDVELSGMKLEEELFSSPGVEDGAPSTNHPTPISDGIKGSPSTKSKASTLQENGDSAAPTPKSEEDGIDGVSSDITIQVEPGKAPKLSRKSSSKMIQKPQPLFNDLPDATEESRSHFTTIRDCVYGSKNMGSSEHDTLGCDCSPEYKNGGNNACGEDSDCINRATKMECTDDECNCGAGCQNQRFQRRQYANVSVIKTEKKGFGLRANKDLQPNDFIFEYIGEVIGEAVFRKRTQLYHDEGIKHFYFMSLTKNVFVDATKKGNLGRFCNHSCNPNCYVDKWVVGEKLRMGIFAERPIKAGEELVFNYNVDRYGADPQPCYCGESNCTGFIGGKTQTERATKLSHAVIEALGIEDGDGWDIAVPKKARKKKQGEDDEEYVSNVQPKGLDENGVTKVMATLMQCKDKWVAVKLLSRVQRCNDEKVRNRVVRMHGYQILRSTLTTWKDDDNVVLQILDILYKLPRLTRNKIVDSKIETAVTLFIESQHEDIAKESKRLLDEWGKLEVGYRIPRKKFDPSLYEQTSNAFDRSRRGSSSRQETPEKTFVAPSGPKSNVPQRQPFYNDRPRPRHQFRSTENNNLPAGWASAQDPKLGKTYYYSKSGQTTWQRPNTPAADFPPPPPPIAQAKVHQKNLQSVIDGITKVQPVSQRASPAPKELEGHSKEKAKKPKEDWRTWPEEKQRRAYETTISQHVIPVMNKFSGKLPKEDLKKFAKEVAKTLVKSDFKNGRVTDLKNVPEKTVSRIKEYVKKFFERAVAKKAQFDAKKAEKKAEASKDGVKGGESRVQQQPSEANMPLAKSEEPEPDRGISDEDINIPSANATPLSPALGTPQEEGLKRKRSHDETDELTPDSPSKRFKESPPEEDCSPTPPPPPPPTNEIPMTLEEEQEDELMRESEAALIKENEEAMVLEDEHNDHKPSNGDHANNTPNDMHHSNGVEAPVSKNGINGLRGGDGANSLQESASESPRMSQSPRIQDDPLANLHPDRRKHLLGL